MTATTLWMRAEWRRSIGSLLALAALLTVAGGVVLAFSAGVRRADTVLDRFMATSQVPDVMFAAPIDNGQLDVQHFNSNIELVDEAAAIEGVDGVAVQSWWALAPEDSVTPGAPVSPFVVGYSALSDGAQPAVVVRGELPGPDDDGVVVNEEAERLGYRIGTAVTLRSVAPAHFDEWAQLDAELPDDTLLDGPTIPTHVAAVVRSIDDLSSDAFPAISVMPGFENLHGDDVAHCNCFVLVRTDGENPDAVAAEIEQLYAPYAMERIPDDPISDVARLAIDVEVTTLRIAAVVAAVAALLLAGQAFGRAVARTTIHQRVMRALGMTSGQLVLGSVLILMPAIAGGALGAVGAATLLSQLFPVGLARTAEVDPGIRADAQTFLVDAPLLFLTGVALVVLLAWRACSHGAEAPRLTPKLITRLFHRPAPALGASFSVDPLGGGVRSRFVATTTFISVAVAVGGFLTVSTFASSTDHLRDTPALYGASGGFVLDSNGDASAAGAVSAAAALPDVTSVTERSAIDDDTVGLADAAFGAASVSVQPAAYRSIRGDGIPTLIAGRLPDSSDEVAVGRKIGSQLGSNVGDTIQLRIGDGRTLDLVETGVVVDWTADSPDRSFIVTDETLRAVGCPAAADECDLAATVFADTDSPEAATSLRDAGFVPTPPPSNVERLDQVGSIPWYLATFLGVLALAGVGHSLASAARRRRRDLAIVRTLGLTASAASRSFGWQAAVVAIAGTTAGVVLGVFGGRVVWGVIASELGVLDRPVVPTMAIAIVSTTMIASAVAIALLPALRSRRARPVDLLRAE